MKTQTYLFFNGRCEEALDFYSKTLGAKVTGLMRFKDGPPPTEQCGLPPGSENKIMHSCFQVGENTVLASDGQCSGQLNFQGFSLALDVPDDAKAQKLFTALSEGGKVQMPLAKTFFASSFGMVADRFGVSWMILAAPVDVASNR